jgi:membrane fusion protein (multidrug efflux system)
VKVVGGDGMVSTRTVKVGPGKDNQWIVLDGLKAGEQVVVEGFQKIPAKAPVKPVPWAATATAAAAASAAKP